MLTLPTLLRLLALRRRYSSRQPMPLMLLAHSTATRLTILTQLWPPPPLGGSPRSPLSRLLTISTVSGSTRTTSTLSAMDSARLTTSLASSSHLLTSRTPWPISLETRTLTETPLTSPPNTLLAPNSTTTTDSPETRPRSPRMRSLIPDPSSSPQDPLPPRASSALHSTATTTRLSKT